MYIYIYIYIYIYSLTLFCNCVELDVTFNLWQLFNDCYKNYVGNKVIINISIKTPYKTK